MSGMVQNPLNVVPDKSDEQPAPNHVNGSNCTNGDADESSTKTSRFDPHFTDAVINATGPKANPRLRKVMASLTRHLHDFCRENEITVDEYMAGIDLINATGKWSDDKRNEGQLLSDIIGLESLVDEITYTLAGEAADAPTSTAILGPFWRKDAPKRKMGDSIVLKDMEGSDHTLMHGRVLDFNTGKPIDNAEIDIWHTAPNGLYEQQDPDQPDMNLRGRFFTGPDGEYSFYCLKPTSYPVPNDGPAGKLLEMLDRHPMRPAHIHFILTAEGYKPLTTQIFDKEDKHIDNDSVFAVKDSLVVDFLLKEGDSKAQYDLQYDFKLISYEAAKKGGVDGATQVAP
ncbi:hypothetical protein B0A55_08246 [Friedmanniomyces simplex]|uniref:Intradiol ring-cleavage dioxygenases domain-containing protein n=1 Tax=Friedmanniomyces simplex TaxID=329884 RepID=A0A4V5NEG3_9PEZI|nr:hypothetical protein B0A55_08246 [Friedmanniomyces simplex]